MSSFWDCCCCLGTRKSGYHDMDKDNTSEKEAFEKQINDMQQEINSLESKLKDETQAKEAAIAAKEEALRRLSEHLALKLTDNNPVLVDLSDVNRPNNLVDKFSQLYDDEWTRVFDDMTKNKGLEDGKEAIKLLLEIVMECFKTCREKSTSQLELILKALNTDLVHASTETKKIIKDTRKKIAIESVPSIQKEVTNHMTDLKESFRELLAEEVMRDYLNRCVEICWLMAVQDPPMALSLDTGEDGKFVKNNFREYTIKGEFVDYFVWPCVLIQDGGTQMAKGIVQCRDSAREATETV